MTTDEVRSEILCFSNNPNYKNYKYKNIFSLKEKYQFMPNDLNEIKNFISINSSL